MWLEMSESGQNILEVKTHKFGNTYLYIKRNTHQNIQGGHNTAS